VKQLTILRQVIVGLLIGTLLSLAVLIGVSYGGEVEYKFRIVDIPLQFTFLGQQRDDIVRLTDINDKGQTVGNDFAGDGFFVDKSHRTIEIRCPGDQTDNHSTTVSAINNKGKSLALAPTAPSCATATVVSLSSTFPAPQTHLLMESMI
jgi:hypothetical protein